MAPAPRAEGLKRDPCKRRALLSSTPERSCPVGHRLHRACRRRARLELEEHEALTVRCDVELGAVAAIQRRKDVEQLLRNSNLEARRRVDLDRHDSSDEGPDDKGLSLPSLISVIIPV